MDTYDLVTYGIKLALRDGMVANSTIFDTATVTDNSDYVDRNSCVAD